MEQRRLPAARRSGDRHHLPVPDGQVQPRQCGDLSGVEPGHAVHLDGQTVVGLVIHG